MPPQTAKKAEVLFPGIRFIESADVSFSALGVSPSAFSIRMAPQPNDISYIGTLRLVFGGSVVAEFPDCMVDSASAEYSESGRLVSIQILDRRWKWVECGAISGSYNVRDSAGKIKYNEKKPRELAKLCLEAMGETGFDVGDLPNDTRPEVEWDFDNPARALNELATGLGCCVVLQANNRVAIRKIGKGAGGVGVKLPAGPMTPQYSSGIDPDDEPDSHVVVGARIRYQVDLELEAVGLEADGSVKPIDDLSYKPPGGWTDVADTHFFASLDTEEKQKLAKQSVFRWYRIKVPFRVPGYAGSEGDAGDNGGKKTTDLIKDLSLITPVENEQVEQEEVDDVLQNKPAVTFGVWLRLAGAVADTSGQTFGPLTDENLCDVNFSIDADRGIVKFSEPVHAFENSKVMPAQLALRTAVSVRDSKTRAWTRYIFEKKKPGQKVGTKPKYLRHEELTLWKKPVYKENDYPNGGATVETNESEIKKEAQKIIEYQRTQYQTRDPETATYAGWFPVKFDGSIQAATFTSNSGGARLTINRNQDRGGPESISFAERQMLAKNRIARDNLAKLIGNKKPAEAAKAAGAGGVIPGGGVQ